MKVKELIKLLADFNPDAETNIIDYSWGDGIGADSMETERDIEKEKLNAVDVQLYDDECSFEMVG